MLQKTAGLLAMLKKPSTVGSGVITKVLGGRQAFDPSKASEGEIKRKKKKAVFPAKKGKCCKKTVTMLRKGQKLKVCYSTT